MVGIFDNSKDAASLAPLRTIPLNIILLNESVRLQDDFFLSLTIDQRRRTAYSSLVFLLEFKVAKQDSKSSIFF